MSIIYSTFGSVGQNGVTPRRVQLTSTDSFETVQSQNYLAQFKNQIYPTDIIDAIYDFDTSTNAGSWAQFTPVITATGISLIPYVLQEDVVLPVVDGNIPEFIGTTGTIGDSGIVANSIVKNVGEAPSGNIPIYALEVGDITDSEIAITDVAIKASALTPGSLLEASITGEIEPTGFAILHGKIEDDIATASVTLPAVGITPACIVTGAIQQSTNVSFIEKITPGTNEITFTFGAAPGNSTVLSFIAVLPL